LSGLIKTDGLNQIEKLTDEDMKAIFAVILFASIVLRTTAQNNQQMKKELTLNTVGYRLFPTENMWTFIKLNTRNGQLWQVQFDVQGHDRFQTDLYLIPLVTVEQEVNDRFNLYPTKNIYTFILLDQLDGKMWQVQWSMEAKNRAVIPIEIN
jgi:hypothetical protein